jgi:hypothetical protein
LDAVVSGDAYEAPARDDTRASGPAPARRLLATTSGRAGRAFFSSTVCGRRACRSSRGPCADAGNNPCRRQADVVVVASLIDVANRGAESASAFRADAGATREPIARCARLHPSASGSGWLSLKGLRLRCCPEPRAGHLLRDAVRQAVAEQLCEEFVGGVDAVGVFERVEIHQEPAYHGERERC